MIKHEEARKKLLFSPLKINNGLIVGDLFKFISDYINEQEKKDELIQRWKELADRFEKSANDLEQKLEKIEELVEKAKRNLLGDYSKFEEAIYELLGMGKGERK